MGEMKDWKQEKVRVWVTPETREKEIVGEGDAGGNVLSPKSSCRSPTVQLSRARLAATTI